MHAQGAVATRQQDISTDSMYIMAAYAFVRLTLKASRSSSSESPSCINQWRPCHAARSAQISGAGA